MKLVRWTRFSWDLAKLPVLDIRIDPHYHIRPAIKEEERSIRNVIMSAFSLDMDWADTLENMKARLESEISAVFEQKDALCLVITHGARIIGASALNLDADAESNLISGPCILSEYRNRGLGSALLYESLLALRERGLQSARGVTKSNVPAAKFLYPKCNSVSESHEYQTQLASS